MISDSGLTPYELRVKRNIEENQRVLKSLGLLNTNTNEDRKNIKKTVRRSNAAVNKRSSFKPGDDKTFSPFLSARRTRRSSSLLESQGEFDEVLATLNEENTPPHKKKRIAQESGFGPIEGVSVGDWWPTRMECSEAGVHRLTVAGIHGKTGEGCYSIALSGGYEDDLDCGEFFTYTGSGGRDLKGTKSNPKNLRTAPQTKDQVLEGPNAHLALNVENHRPVRVIRGYKLQSPYAPEEGYRYDGLYSVERCWTATGLAGFKVYKYALKRLPDQDPPPWIANESIVPAQNGDNESREGGSLVENGNEDNSTIQSISSDFFKVPRKCIKPSPNNSPNLDSNIKCDDKETEFETPRTKDKISSNLRSSEEYLQKSKSISFNSTLQVIKIEDEDSDEIQTPILKAGATIKHMNSVTEQNLHQTFKRKRTPSLPSNTTQHKEIKAQNFDYQLYLQEPKQNTTKDNQETKMNTQVSTKKMRLSNSPIDYPKERNGELTNLKNDLECSLHKSKSLSLNSNYEDLSEGQPKITVKRTKNSLKETDVELESPKNLPKTMEIVQNESDRNIPLKGSTRYSNSNEESNIVANKGVIKEKNVHPNTNKSVNSEDLFEHGESKCSVLNGLKSNETSNSQNNTRYSFYDREVNSYDERKVCSSTKFPVDSCQDKNISSNGNVTDLNGSPSDKSTQRCNGTPPTSSAKKTVTFSPDVFCKDEGGKKYSEPLFCINCQNINCTCMLAYHFEVNETRIQAPIENSKSDGKKQMSILKYFSPSKRTEERSTSTGILLRGIRRLFPTCSSIMDSNSLKNTVPSKQCQLPQNKSKGKDTQEQLTKSKSNDGSVQNQNNFLSPTSPIKPCSVKLFRLSNLDLEGVLNVCSNTFIGWENDVEGLFLGFDYDEEHKIFCYGFNEIDIHSKDLPVIRSLIEKMSAGS